MRIISIVIGALLGGVLGPYVAKTLGPGTGALPAHFIMYSVAIFTACGALLVLHCGIELPSNCSWLFGIAIGYALPEILTSIAHMFLRWPTNLQVLSAAADLRHVSPLIGFVVVFACRRWLGNFSMMSRSLAIIGETVGLGVAIMAVAMHPIPFEEDHDLFAFVVSFIVATTVAVGGMGAVIGAIRKEQRGFAVRMVKKDCQ